MYRDNTKNIKQQAELSGVLKLNGSTAKEFMKLYPGVKIDVEQKSAQKTHWNDFFSIKGC